MANDHELDKQQERDEALDFKYQEEQAMTPAEHLEKAKHILAVVRQQLIDLQALIDSV